MPASLLPEGYGFVFLALFGTIIANIYLMIGAYSMLPCVAWHAYTSHDTGARYVSPDTHFP